MHQSKAVIRYFLEKAGCCEHSSECRDFTEADRFGGLRPLVSKGFPDSPLFPRHMALLRSYAQSYQQFKKIIDLYFIQIF